MTDLSQGAATPVSDGANALHSQPTLPGVLASPRRTMRRTRWIIAATMLVLIGLVVARLASVVGWVTPVRIAGSSMAETLVGAHYRVKCDDCGLSFRCDALAPPADRTAVCPNCGYKRNSLDDAELRPGERVLIDRWRTTRRSPLRGEVIALRSPDQDGSMAVKRVVALPGERWGIRDGDLYINDAISRKSFRELLERRVLVHDNDHQPTRTKDLPPRWQSSDTSNRWQPVGTGFVFTPAEGDDDSSNSSANSAESGPAADDAVWLRYQHWACTGANRPRSDASPVLDNDSYNQAANRSLNAQSDIMLSCSVESDPEGSFAIAARDGEHHFHVVLDRKQRNVKLIDARNNRVLAEARERPFSDARRLDIAVALCDQQVFVAEGGHVLISYPYQRKKVAETLEPLAIGGMRGRIQVNQLRVYRDIYYLDPNGTGRPWSSEGPLGPREMAVLGDNPPLSTDSRHFGGVATSDVVGLVHRPFWNAAAEEGTGR